MKDLMKTIIESTNTCYKAGYDAGFAAGYAQAKTEALADLIKGEEK